MISKRFLQLCPDALHHDAPDLRLRDFATLRFFLALRLRDFPGAFLPLGSRSSATRAPRWKGRVLLGSIGKGGAVDDEQIVDFVYLVELVENRALRIRAHAACPVLVDRGAGRVEKERRWVIAASQALVGFERQHVRPELVAIELVARVEHQNSDALLSQVVGGHPPRRRRFRRRRRRVLRDFARSPRRAPSTSRLEKATSSNALRACTHRTRSRRCGPRSRALPSCPLRICSSRPR